jgi:hypothetical protein
MSQESDAPKEPLPSGCSGIPDAAPRAALGIDHQLDVWAKGSPFRHRLGGCGPIPCAEFMGELSDALGAIFRDEDRDLAQALASALVRALALGDRRGRVAGIDLCLCLGLCLLTGLPDGRGLVLSNIRTAPVAVPAPPQARRWMPGGAATKEEAVNTDSNARFGGEVEWNVSRAPIALRFSSR